MSLDCVIYCAFYSILFRGAVFSGHGVNPRFTYLLNYLLIWTGLTWRRCMLKPEGDGCCTTIDVDDTELNVLSV